MFEQYTRQRASLNSHSTCVHQLHATAPPGLQNKWFAAALKRFVSASSPDASCILHARISHALLIVGPFSSVPEGNRYQKQWQVQEQDGALQQYLLQVGENKAGCLDAPKMLGKDAYGCLSKCSTIPAAGYSTWFYSGAFPGAPAVSSP